MLEQVFLRFREFLAALVLVKTVPSACNAGGLESKDEVIVVLPVEEGHEALFTCESLVDEQVFLVVLHRVAKVHRLDAPAVCLKLMDDDPSEVLVVNGIVRTKCGRIVVEDDGLVAMVRIVRAEIVDERRDFPLELGVEGLDDVKPVALRLAILISVLLSGVPSSLPLTKLR